MTDAGGEDPPAPGPELPHYLLRHINRAAQRELAAVLQALDVLDGFALYLVATRANRALVSAGYADRVELRCGRTVTVIERGSVRRIQLPDNPAQQRRRLTDTLEGE